MLKAGLSELSRIAPVETARTVVRRISPLGPSLVEFPLANRRSSDSTTPENCPVIDLEEEIAGAIPPKHA